MLRSQTLRCRASVFNIWYLFCTQNWSLYFNLLTSGVDFARIRRVFGLSSQNRFLFGLLPITEGKSLGSALLPRISNITEKLLYKSGAFWLWFCRNQSLVTGLGKKTKFLWPTSEHKGRRLENAIYCSLMATYQRSWFMNLLPSCCDFAEISFWSLVLKKKLNFFGPLPNTEDKSLENALLFLNGDIAEKVGC